MNLIPYLYYLSLFIDNLIKVPTYFKTHIEITSSMAPRCLGSKKSGVLIKNFSSLIRRIFGRSKVVDTILIFAVVLKSRQLYHQDLNIIFDIIGIQLVNTTELVAIGLEIIRSLAPGDEHHRRRRRLLDQVLEGFIKKQQVSQILV